MKFFRRRITTVLFFGLISFGQAHPFATAWAMGKNTHPCCCSSAVAKPCDCDHSGHAKKFRCHEERSIGYKQLPCGAEGKTQDEILSFRGDPFVPSRTRPMPLSLESRPLTEFVLRLPSVFRSPESPPPRA